MAGLTVKQEAFCHAYIACGGNASEAYRQSYDAEGMQSDSVHVCASRVLADAKVALMIKNLREAIAESNKITVDDLIRELEEARQAALSAEIVQSSAATGATMGKAKLLGLDKQTIELIGGLTVTAITRTVVDPKADANA